MNYLITICARGGSKGVPGKNIKEINGKPLIYYTINIAQQLAEKYKADIALSTDSEEIKSVAESFGLFSNYLRPDFLASDNAGKVDAINDVREFFEKENGVEYDFIIDLDVTSPIRTLKDIEKAIITLEENSEALNIFSVSEAGRNPYFNMVEIKENGFYDVVKKNDTLLTRQSAPEVFDMNASFYIYKKKFFKEGHRSAITNFSLVFVMNHVCFDLDNNIDFEFMEFLISKNQVKL